MPICGLFNCPRRHNDAANSSRSGRPHVPRLPLPIFPGYWESVGRFLKQHRSIALNCLFDSFQLYTYAYLEPPIAKVVFDGNDTVAWIVWSVPFVTMPVGAPLFGRLADKYGRKVAIQPLPFSRVGRGQEMEVWEGGGGLWVKGPSSSGSQNGVCAPQIHHCSDQVICTAGGGGVAGPGSFTPTPPPPPTLELAPKCQTIGAKGAESKIFLMWQRVKNCVFTLCVYAQYTRIFQEKSVVGKMDIFSVRAEITIPPLSRASQRWPLP